MAEFIVITPTTHDHEKVMEIIIKNSIMHHNAFGGPGRCVTECVGSWNQYKIFEDAITNGVFKGELEKMSDESL